MFYVLFSFSTVQLQLTLEHFAGLHKQGVLGDFHFPSVGGEMPLESVSYTEKGRPTIIFSLFCSGLRIESSEDVIQGFKGHG